MREDKTENRIGFSIHLAHLNFNGRQERSYWSGNVCLSTRITDINFWVVKAHWFIRFLRWETQSWWQVGIWKTWMWFCFVMEFPTINLFICNKLNNCTILLSACCNFKTRKWKWLSRARCKGFFCTLKMFLCLLTAGRGILSGKEGMRKCGPDGYLFGLRFTNGPFFYLKIDLHIGRIFAKCLIFDDFFPLVYLQVVKKYLCIPIYMIKSTGWFKCTLQETMVYAWVTNLCLLWFIGWWSKLPARHSYPTQIWVPSLESAIYCLAD